MAHASTKESVQPLLLKDVLREPLRRRDALHRWWRMRAPDAALVGGEG